MNGGTGMDHRTVEPPTQGEREKTRSDITLEVLRNLNEDWEYMKEHDRRRYVRNAIRVLEHE